MLRQKLSEGDGEIPARAQGAHERFPSLGHRQSSREEGVMKSSLSFPCLKLILFTPPQSYSAMGSHVELYKSVFSRIVNFLEDNSKLSSKAIFCCLIDTPKNEVDLRASFRAETLLKDIPFLRMESSPYASA